MEADVWYRRLAIAISDELDLRDRETRDVRDLLCVTSRESGRVWGPVVAPEDDAARWRAASETVIAAIGSVQERAAEVRRRYQPPRTLGKRLWWRLRRSRLRRAYEDQRSALEDEARRAYRAYRDAAGDLTDYVEARDREEEEARREREARLRAERLAAVQDAVGGAGWAYRLTKEDHHRQMLIWISAVERLPGEEHGDARRNMTARQMQRAVEEERARDPYVWIAWREKTRKALAEWNQGQTEVQTWQRLTGVVLETYVFRPGELEEMRARRPDRGYGPSSTYWGP
ncbi:hypothetical protein ACIA5C_32180 [Actinoplanes sp. NPDC051343]|uniref:hypothetical protein n=1 Tax=Actinoplanes sp. NPDC051343 TaxID=3363906 RepID=UPI0037BCF9B9